MDIALPTVADPLAEALHFLRIDGTLCCRDVALFVCGMFYGVGGRTPDALRNAVEDVHGVDVC